MVSRVSANRFSRYWQFLANEIANRCLISPMEVRKELCDHYGRFPNRTRDAPQNRLILPLTP